MEKFEITKSKTGLNCLWEDGGGLSNTGHVTLIANSIGGMKKAIYIKNHGELACRQHALIPVQIGDIVCKCKRHRAETETRIFQITKITNQEGKTYAEAVEIDANQDIFDNICNEAIRKVNIYHCRGPVYVVKPEYKKS